jgi:hypothetical protein
MTAKRRITSLQELLDALEKLAAKKDNISLRNVVEEVGHRSFGPLLLFAGLVMAAPGIGDIPGVPTGVGIFTLLVAGQMLLQRHHVWLPAWLLKRSVSDERLEKAVGWIRTPARYLDFVVKKRWVALTNNAGAVAISAACSAIALFTPFMEIVLFAANIAGAAIATFGLSLIAHDGVLALVAFVLTAILVGSSAYMLLG